jgi:hypothetical protein
MTQNSLSTRSLAPPTIPSSSTQFRCLFAKKSADPHPPYPVEPVFCSKFSCNNLYINHLYFKHVYQSVTVNRPFCPLFGLKNRSFHPKRSPFHQFSRPFLPIHLVLKPSFKTLKALHSIPR